MSAERFPVEVNGPANIVMLGEQMRRLLVLAQMDGDADSRQAKIGKALKLAASIDSDAHRTIKYIQALGRGERPAWHEIKNPKEA